MSIAIEVDTTVNAAYIRLSEDDVARTVEFSDHIMVDLNEFGVAVGIEVLDEGAQLPFQELMNDFHVHSEVVDLLRVIRPNVRAFLKMTTGSDGTSVSQPLRQLVDA